MTTKLTAEEREYLLQTARKSITQAFQSKSLPELSPQEAPGDLAEPGACFVTLNKDGELRGCVGSIEAARPLIEDVQKRALAAAFEDPRFPPLTEEELGQIQIEISALTKPEELPYDSPEELPGLFRPGIDGVILSQGYHRATFLPQVWEKLPEPELFLGRLCQKMGLPPQAWKETPFRVQIYQVEKFAE